VDSHNYGFAQWRRSGVRAAPGDTFRGVTVVRGGETNMEKLVNRLISDSATEEELKVTIPW